MGLRDAGWSSNLQKKTSISTSEAREKSLSATKTEQNYSILPIRAWRAGGLALGIASRLPIGQRTCPICGEIYNIYSKPPMSDNVCDLHPDTQLSHRSDDNEASVRTRLETYEKSTAPLIEYFDRTGRLQTIVDRVMLKPGPRPIDVALAGNGAEAAKHALSAGALTALVHLYRAEVGRMTAYRQRLAIGGYADGANSRGQRKRQLPTRHRSLRRVFVSNRQLPLRVGVSGAC